MSNLKISQLPEWTGDTEGFYIPVNNSGETTTYKVLKETLVGGSGTSGTSGSSGSSGTSGISGSSGTSGVSGSSGTSGTNGSSGTSGTNGSSGTDGTSGTNGSSGTSGVSGSSGTSGVSGSSGTSGTNGSSGTDGTSGTSGISGSSGTSGTSSATSGESFTIITISSSSTTNGTNLLAAYTEAKTKTPYGNALGISNRYTIILPPGIYDLGSSILSLDTSYIDIVGSTTDLSNHQIRGNTSGYVSVATNSLELRNLYLLNNSNSYGFIYGGNRPGLVLDNIFFGYGANAAPWQAVNESEFSGVATRIAAGQYYSALGSSTSSIGNAGAVSGTLSNINANSPIADGAVSGFIFNCSGGVSSFGGRGYYGNSTGFMMNCRVNGSNGFANQPSGVYVNCYANDGAWQGIQSTTLAGTYINCHSSAGATSFGQSGTHSLSGTMFLCSKRGSADFATPTGSGVIRLSIDGTNTITNLP